MVLVVDASLAAAWFLPDEQNAAADQVIAELDKNPGRAPSLFWFETRNLFLVAERCGRLQPGEAATSMAQLRGFPILDEGTGADRLVLALAERHGLSGYDATYLPLATLDKKLATAARAQGVTVRGVGAAPSPRAMILPSTRSPASCRSRRALAWPRR
jgi:predicted nucleic acid-binding protein